PSAVSSLLLRGWDSSPPHRPKAMRGGPRLIRLLGPEQGKPQVHHDVEAAGGHEHANQPRMRPDELVGREAHLLQRLACLAPGYTPVSPGLEALERTRTNREDQTKEQRAGITDEQENAQALRGKRGEPLRAESAHRLGERDFAVRGSEDDEG